MKFAVVFPWPGVTNAEYELIKRLFIAVGRLPDTQMVVVDNHGVILDQSSLNYQKDAARRVIDPGEVDFVLSMHYQSGKTIDSFWYTANWNPPEFLMRDVRYEEYVENYLSSDDFLTYDSDGMNHFLATLLLNDKRGSGGSGDYLKNTLRFLPSTPELDLRASAMPNRKLFYCGINWEKCAGGKARHQSVFKLLDRMDYMRVYGPEKFLGIRPWEGFRAYQRSLPFDGVSLIREINACGVALLLSSDVHRRAGAASSRLYEACAAGAVMISDDNAFVKKHFGDCALFIEYDAGAPEETFRQIDAHMRFLNENPDKAFALAQRAQDIWRNGLTLEHQVDRLCREHGERYRLAQTFFGAQRSEEPVDVAVLWTSSACGEFAEALDNIKRQTYANIRVCVACDVSLQEQLAQIAREALPHCEVHVSGLALRKRGELLLTRGQMLVQLGPNLVSPYFMILGDREVWFKEHVSTLKRAMEDQQQAACAYSKCFRRSMSGQYPCLRDAIRLEALYELSRTLFTEEFAGIFLFRRLVLAEVPDFVFDNMDGLEACLLMSHCLVNKRGGMVASKRRTMGKIVEGPRARKRERILDVFEQTNVLSGFLGDWALSQKDASLSWTMEPSSFERSLANYVYFLLGKDSRLTHMLKRVYRYVRKHGNG